MEQENLKAFFTVSSPFLFELMTSMFRQSIFSSFSSSTEDMLLSMACCSSFPVKLFLCKSVISYDASSSLVITCSVSLIKLLNES